MGPVDDRRVVSGEYGEPGELLPQREFWARTGQVRALTAEQKTKLNSEYDGLKG